jgi:hypothetical protein
MTTEHIQPVRETEGRTRKVSSADRVLMFSIERWPVDLEQDWLRNMGNARSNAERAGLTGELVQVAVMMGLERLIWKADQFRAVMVAKIQEFVSEHEIPASEIMEEMQYRIGAVQSEFRLTNEQIAQAVIGGMSRYIDDGGSPEFGIGLADLLGIPADERKFLRITITP